VNAPDNKSSWNRSTSSASPERDHNSASDASRPEDHWQEQPWLREIGWNSPAQGGDAHQNDRGHRAAPMHRRNELGSNAELQSRLAALRRRPMPQPPNLAQSKLPTRPRFRPPAQARRPVSQLAVGTLATLIASLCFAVAFDVTSGGKVRSTLASVWPVATSAPVEKNTTVRRRQPPALADVSSPAASVQAPLPAQTAKAEIPVMKLPAVETPAVAPPPDEPLAVAEPVNEAPVSEPAAEPPTNPQRTLQTNTAVAALATPEALPTPVASLPEAKPAVPFAATPETQAPVVPQAEAPKEIALASPPALQSAPTTEREVFQDCANCPEMVVVEAGTFDMGSTPDNPQAQLDEFPTHRVSITKPFAVGRFEITEKDWEQCVASGGCQPLALNEGWNDPQQPAIKISWDDAKQQYLPWISKVTGKSYRLPTEAEWEYAARGGSAGGATEAGDTGNHATTIAVGSLAPNTLGLHGMLGNVWEWVEDCWSDNYKSTPVDGSAAVGGNCKLRVVRGGSWASGDTSLRFSKRGWNKPTTHNNTVGFRIARSL
jgi:formylglycine-generating enzyme required for sulfatase activity